MISLASLAREKNLPVKRNAKLEILGVVDGHDNDFFVKRLTRKSHGLIPHFRAREESLEILTSILMGESRYKLKLKRELKL